MRGKLEFSVVVFALAAMALLSGCSGAGAGGSTTTGTTGDQDHTVYASDTVQTDTYGQPATTASGEQGDNIVVVGEDFFDQDDNGGADIKQPETTGKTDSATSGGQQPVTQLPSSATNAGGQQPTQDEWTPNY